MPVGMKDVTRCGQVIGCRWVWFLLLGWSGGAWRDLLHDVSSYLVRINHMVKFTVPPGTGTERRELVGGTKRCLREGCRGTSSPPAPQPGCAPAAAPRRV